MQNNPLNIVEKEWPECYDALKPALFAGIPSCVAAHYKTYNKTTSADVIVCSIYCVVDFLIEYRDNTTPLNVCPYPL